MNKSDIKILIDMDDTIEDLVPAWVAWLDQKYDLEVKPEDVDCWEIQTKFPTLSKAQVAEPLFLNKFWETVKPKRDAIFYVHKLFEDGYDLYLCTNSNLITIASKLECIIDLYFPYLRHKVIIIEKKQMLRADFLIDDNPDNLLGGEYKKILFSCPHNKLLTDDKKSQMYLITNSWEEIYNTIEKYFARLRLFG